MKKTICLLAILCTFQLVQAQLQTGEDVAVTNTDAGKVRGYIHNAVYTYKGIPYAEAKRFEAAKKPKPWTAIRSSLTYGPVAPLPTPTTTVQDESEFLFHHDWGYTNEDCLRANVWTPGINDGKKRPVLFWIHGGGFTAGSSQELPSYDGENLAKRGDVVVVSINHRLNVLGFLDLSAYGEKYKHSANNSILDIKMALEWVKANIANFGGDPDNVTIFGQSGGGAKVNTLMAMPSVKGLFHKAINESGSFRSTLKEKASTQEVAAEVLNVLNIPASNVDSLQKIPFQVLSDASAKAFKIVNDRKGKPADLLSGGFGPSVDGIDLPYQLFSKEAFELSKDVPLLIGTVKNEFAPSMFMNMSKATKEQVVGFIKSQQKDKTNAYIAAVQKAYPNDTKPTDLMDVDVIFRPGAIRQAKEKAALNAAPVYMYLFTWQSPVMDGKFKAVHCMEIPFAFFNIDKCVEMTGGTKEAYELSKKVSDAWINFARSGNPNHKGLPIWPKFDASKTATMHFDNKCEVLPQMDKELYDLLGL
ncbi:MAG: carboxylesterase family protein [Chitinophagaceae bacterium]|nr:carboxylesterase family protein [Chitinophagaceae bacterium]